MKHAPSPAVLAAFTEASVKHAPSDRASHISRPLALSTRCGNFVVDGDLEWDDPMLVTCARCREQLALETQRRLTPREPPLSGFYRSR